MMDSEVLQCLAASLNTDPNARVRAELRLNELFAIPGLCGLDHVDGSC